MTSSSRRWEGMNSPRTCRPNGVDDQHRLRFVTKDVPRVYDDIERVHREPAGRNCHSKFSNQIFPRLKLVALIKTHQMVKMMAMATRSVLVLRSFSSRAAARPSAVTAESLAVITAEFCSGWPLLVLGPGALLSGGCGGCCCCCWRVAF